MYQFSDAAKQTVWENLVAQDGHWFETRVRINNVTYAQSQIMSMSINYRLFTQSQPSVGGCLAGELNIKMLAPSASIPRMAKVEPFVRVTNGVTTSDWMPQGKFWIDTRETTNNDDNLPILTLTCYDAMLKSEGDFPSTTQSYPRSDINVVKEIAKAMGLQSSINATTGIDSRTISLMTRGYSIGLPIGYSMREVLSNIAAMYAANWVMNYDGKLLLVAINGIPPETNYLIDNASDAITFGGDRILV